MARIFKTPFAAQGDKDTIPTPTQGDGSVSITQGFGFDYQREYEDPLAKDIRREDVNGILHDITEAVGDIQLTGVAKWSADAAPYPTGAVVWHNGTTWLSLVENNEVEPVAGANWAAQRPATLFVEKSANLSDLTNAATARTNLGLGDSATLNVGTTSGTVAAGNDSRITGAAQKSANLSDLTNAATARANLGVPYATAAQAQAMTSDGVVITPKKLWDAFLGSRQNSGNPGFQLLPGGLKIQWGTIKNFNGTQFNDVYPVAFTLRGIPSICVLEETSNNMFYAQITSRNVTGFTGAIYHAVPAAGSGGPMMPGTGGTPVTIVWMAVGL